MIQSYAYVLDMSEIEFCWNWNRTTIVHSYQVRLKMAPIRFLERESCHMHLFFGLNISWKNTLQWTSPTLFKNCFRFTGLHEFMLGGAIETYLFTQDLLIQMIFHHTHTLIALSLNKSKIVNAVIFRHLLKCCRYDVQVSLKDSQIWWLDWDKQITIIVSNLPLENYHLAY